MNTKKNLKVNNLEVINYNVIVLHLIQIWFQGFVSLFRAVECAKKIVFMHTFFLCCNHFGIIFQLLFYFI